MLGMCPLAREWVFRRKVWHLFTHLSSRCTTPHFEAVLAVRKLFPWGSRQRPYFKLNVKLAHPVRLLMHIPPDFPIHIYWHLFHILTLTRVYWPNCQFKNMRSVLHLEFCIYHLSLISCHTDTCNSTLLFWIAAWYEHNTVPLFSLSFEEYLV